MLSPQPTRLPGSIGRRLDPSWPSNRAVLLLLPLAAVASGGLALYAASGLRGALYAAVAGAATVLGSWALGRELAPDDQRAAFLALALAFGTLVLLPGQSLLLLFSALLLTRIVNRTVGPPPTFMDSLVVTALAGATLVSTDNPAVGLVASATFSLDAMLPDGRRAQWGFAVACLFLTGTFALNLLPWVTGTGPFLLPPSSEWLGAVALVTVLYLTAIARTRTLASRADVYDTPLSNARVRAGMAVALALALFTLSKGDAGVREACLIWATLTAVGVSGLFPVVARAS